MNKKGFTLVELLAVIAVIAILSGIAIPNVMTAVNSNRRNNFLLDARRMIAKADNLLALDIDARNRINEEEVLYTLEDLNVNGEFQTDADGNTFTDAFVKIIYNENKYKYCICVIGTKKEITKTEGVCSHSNPLDSCIMNDELGLDKVKDK